MQPPCPTGTPGQSKRQSLGTGLPRAPGVLLPGCIFGDCLVADNAARPCCGQVVVGEVAHYRTDTMTADSARRSANTKLRDFMRVPETALQAQMALDELSVAHSGLVKPHLMRAALHEIDSSLNEQELDALETSVAEVRTWGALGAS